MEELRLSLPHWIKIASTSSLEQLDVLTGALVMTPTPFSDPQLVTSVQTVLLSASETPWTFTTADSSSSDEQWLLFLCLITKISFLGTFSSDLGFSSSILELIEQIFVDLEEESVKMNVRDDVVLITTIYRISARILKLGQKHGMSYQCCITFLSGLAAGILYTNLCNIKYQTNHSYQKNKMDFRQDLRGDEDEVFYSQLRRQVILLIEEDEEEILEQRNSITKQFGHQRHTTTSLIPTVSYFTWLENGSCDSVPAWLSSLWRTSNDTGILIPLAVKKPRRHRSCRNRKNIYHQRAQNTCT